MNVGIMETKKDEKEEEKGASYSLIIIKMRLTMRSVF